MIVARFLLPAPMGKFGDLLVAVDNCWPGAMLIPDPDAPDETTRVAIDWDDPSDEEMTS